MIRLPARAMAHYLVSNDAARLQLLRDWKYLGPPAIGHARFYAEARAAIAAYHRGALGRDTIEARIIGMREDARYAGSCRRSELVNNADVLERYLYYQGHRVLQLAPPLAAHLVRSEVEIRVRPSLFAIEDDDRRRLIFHDLRESCQPALLRVMAELAFEAFRAVLCNLPPSAVQVIDVRRGRIVELQQDGSAIGRELAAACQAITTAWPELTPPRGAAYDTRPTERQLAIAWDADG